MNQEFICKAFCENLRVRELSNGYAISTPYETFLGDELSFYALKSGNDDEYRIFEDGTIVPHLEAAGATLENSTRHAALTQMLHEHHSSFDENRGELFRNVESGAELGTACLDFMGLLLRVRDLLLMVQEKAESTFREDARIAVISALSGLADIKEKEPVSDELSEISPDMVITAPNRDPVALFIATSPTKLHEAIELQIMATYEKRIPLKVVALLETDTSITGRIRQRADNRLNALPRFRLEEKTAIERISREVLGWQAVVEKRLH